MTKLTSIEAFPPCSLDSWIVAENVPAGRDSGEAESTMASPAGVMVSQPSAPSPYSTVAISMPPNAWKSPAPEFLRRIVSGLGSSVPRMKVKANVSADALKTGLATTSF